MYSYQDDGYDDEVQRGDGETKHGAKGGGVATLGRGHMRRGISLGKMLKTSYLKTHNTKY
ncbi:MAG: hypothetical protein MJE68_08040 [Proteobacteria bacterium]|nr:hypothetical protein [Pseudomonadota bacterium]